MRFVFPRQEPFKSGHHDQQTEPELCWWLVHFAPRLWWRPNMAGRDRNLARESLKIIAHTNNPRPTVRPLTIRWKAVQPRSDQVWAVAVWHPSNIWTKKKSNSRFNISIIFIWSEMFFYSSIHPIKFLSEAFPLQCFNRVIKVTNNSIKFTM